MKKAVSIYFLFILLAINFSCKKSDNSSPGVTQPAGTKVSQAILDKIKKSGFNTNGVYKHENGFIVEGDIFLDEASLEDSLPGNNIIVANEEQYRTNLLVTPKTITITYVGGSTAVKAAVINAVARFNAEPLTIQFSYRNPVFMRGVPLADVIVSDATDNPEYIAYSGFPKRQITYHAYFIVVPYPTIYFNTAYAGWNANTLTTVLAHEMGHCIGFRHTDYMNRSYSGCFVDASHPGNEGTGSDGAVYIPGTPVGPDPDSWMLSCIGNGTDRPFNANDKIALNYLY